MEHLAPIVEPAVQAGAVGLCALLIALIVYMVWQKGRQEAKRDEDAAKREERILTVVENNSKAYQRLTDALGDQSKLIDDSLKLQRENQKMLLTRPCIARRQEGSG